RLSPKKLPPRTHVIVLFARLNDGGGRLTSGARWVRTACRGAPQRVVGISIKQRIRLADKGIRACLGRRRLWRKPARCYDLLRLGVTVSARAAHAHIWSANDTVSRRSVQEGTPCTRALELRPRPR